MAVGNRTGTSREPIGEGAIVTGQEQPHDPVLRVVADYWEGIRRYADPGQWQRLTDLIGGAAEEEADEARAALADELLDILPPHHPASQLLRTGIMYSGDQPDRPEAELADDLRRWLEGEPIRARHWSLLERALEVWTGTVSAEH